MKKIAIIACLGALTVSCNTEEPKQVDHRAEMSERIDSLESVLRAADDVLDTSLAEEMIHAYADFNKGFPEDTLVVENAYNLGVIYSNLPGKELYAVEQFIIVYEDYPDHPLAPQALYNIGIVFDGMGDRERSAKSFQEFVNVFPEHVWADAAKAMIELNTDSVDLEAQVDQWLQQAQ